MSMVPLENIDFSQFSVQQRIDLIGRIWDTLDESSAQLSKAQCAELDRRAAEYEAREEKGISWQELKRRVGEGS